jgi:hypothetical protein
MGKRRIKQILLHTIYRDTDSQQYAIYDKAGNMVKNYIHDQNAAEKYIKEQIGPAQTPATVTAVAEKPNKGSEQVVSVNAMGDAFERAGVVPLPKPGNYVKDIKGIFALFKDRLGVPDENTKMRLEQYWKDLETKGQPAFERLQEAICITSSKTRAEQRTIAYVIGIIKQWQEYGYGNNLTDEQKKVIMIFEKKIGMPLTLPARGTMLKLFATYGIVDVMTVMFQAELEPPNIDISLLYVQQLDSKIDELADAAGAKQGH